ncbi:polysaccharide biosynthesis/export family protein [Luteirhabdus pelagi]|uniref:polysaccharide biosynthesis/export family protein n=1 Tax=Luteirhabdus pelagi TaxID=2792783 RepID=UPI00193ADAF0|nr:polysaccharide biosynthesis/export family protein [Luteirhabdus pelagi]
MKKLPIVLLLIAVWMLQSCASKKDILYFQDADSYSKEAIDYENSKVQPNDILNISVSALVPETAIPYNMQLPGNNVNMDLDVLKLQGYLVSTKGKIVFPVLGRMDVAGLTTEEIEQMLELKLEEGGHLNEPTVSVRLLNAKVTVLGEVKMPGTYTFTEQNITLPQALGYAGDLTINGEREDILLIRDEQGTRKIMHVDLTETDWFDSDRYYVQPNDVIIVNPNDAKVKSAGFIGNAGTVLTLASLVLTSIVLITR